MINNPNGILSCHLIQRVLIVRYKLFHELNDYELPKTLIQIVKYHLPAEYIYDRLRIDSS